jgi:hypothetical protein
MPPETASSNNPDLPQTFVSSDKSLRFNYPAGWVTQANQFSQVMLANSDKALADTSKSTPTYLLAGEVGVDIVYFPVEQAPPNLDVNGDPVKSLQGVVKQSASEPIYTFGEVKKHQLGAYSTASVVMEMEGTNIAVIVYLFFIDRNVVVVGGVAPSNEITHLEPTIEAIIMSLKSKV